MCPLCAAKAIYNFLGVAQLSEIKGHTKVHLWSRVKVPLERKRLYLVAEGLCIVVETHQ